MKYKFKYPGKEHEGDIVAFQPLKKKSDEQFYNPKIKKTTITIEGVPSQLYAQGMRRYQHWEEIQKYFGDSREEYGMGVLKL